MFLLGLMSVLSSWVMAADFPKGFEKPGLIEKLKAGEVVYEEVKSTQTAYTGIHRAYFYKVSPEAYVAEVTQHKKYPDHFTEILQGETTKIEKDHSWNYWLEMVVKVGIFSFKVYPELHHVFTPGKDAISEAVLLNELTNYGEHVKTATQTSRLIPYEGGMLIEDTINVEVKTANSQSGTIKKQVKDFFGKYIKVFRKVLKGDKA